ncbi:class I histocompatibility antigen, F10 alpha chain-like isoform X2 [Prinia subflava]|uniref:class I histocompatibility antigen, F10 alpha chain-like isoform X2 n=1 Tax=Prinia subflava TaxID=208062 RepID=UPI002FE28D15
MSTRRKGRGERERESRRLGIRNRSPSAQSCSAGGGSRTRRKNWIHCSRCFPGFGPNPAGSGHSLSAGPGSSAQPGPGVPRCVALQGPRWIPEGSGGVPGRDSVLHSLRYLQVAVSEPSPGVPQFMSTGFVDGIPFVRYDSERGRAEPLTQWMKEGAEPGYWDRETQINERNQHMDIVSLETLRDRYNQSRGLHTMQRLAGCDLLSDGSVRGSYRDGYDGRDFLSFELGSGRFVAADSAAEITRRHWEHEGNEAERWTNYLKHECPEWLWKYVGYGKKELERKEPPDVHVSGKEEHGTLILSCHAYGFYPNTIVVNWMKGDEIWDQETEWGGIVPNSDGTFHTWARIEALLEEREQYWCRVEHPGMLEPRIFAWEPTSGRNFTVVVAVSAIAAILIFTFLIDFIVWMLQSGWRDRNGYNMAARRDVGTNGSITGITV